MRAAEFETVRPWSATAAFDLCLIFAEASSGARYGGDEGRLAAFMEGYGDLPALRRHPTSFVPELRAIIETALARIGAAAPGKGIERKSP